MADYTKTTNFTSKDALTTGDPNKVIKGSQHDTEFDNIATAVATKANKVVSGTANGILIQTAGGDLADSVKTLPTGTVVGTSDTQTLTNKTINADSNTITNIDNADIKSGANIDAAKIGTAVVSTTEYNYLNGVTSAIQTQLTAKAAKGANSDITSLSGLTTDLSVAQGGTGASTAAGALSNFGLTATAAELNKLDGVTATTAELNKLSGVTATTAEINLLDGVTSTAAELNLLDGAVLRHKVIDIGDWNMAANASNSVAHGLTSSNIRSVSVLIRGDVELPATYDFYYNNNNHTSGHGIYLDATNIVMTRAAGSFFEFFQFDATSYNRGWITIQYVD